MLISELPENIKELAILRRNEYAKRNNINEEIDNLLHAFTWINTPEGQNFWHDIYRGRSYLYYEHYIKQNPQETEQKKNISELFEKKLSDLK